MEKRHIIQLQGREFVTYEGLLDEAHAQGLKAVRTTLVQVPSDDNGQTAICTAEVELTQNGEVRHFTGIGDASPRNVNRNIANHLIRMAETRAKARALRDAINVGMTALEELEEAELPREEGGFGPGPGPRLTVMTAPALPPGVRKGTDAMATRKQIDEVTKEMKRTGLPTEEGRAYLLKHFGKVSRAELTSGEIVQFIAFLKGRPSAETSEAAE